MPKKQPEPSADVLASLPKAPNGKPIMVLWGSWGDMVGDARKMLEEAGYLVIVQPNGACGMREVMPAGPLGAEMSQIAAIALGLVRTWNSDNLRAEFGRQVLGLIGADDKHPKGRPR